MSDEFTVAATKALWVLNAALCGWLIGRGIAQASAWLSIYGPA